MLDTTSMEAKIKVKNYTRILIVNNELLTLKPMHGIKNKYFPKLYIRERLEIKQLHLKLETLALGTSYVLKNKKTNRLVLESITFLPKLPSLQGPLNLTVQYTNIKYL